MFDDEISNHYKLGNMRYDCFFLIIIIKLFKNDSY